MVRLLQVHGCTETRRCLYVEHSKAHITCLIACPPLWGCSCSSPVRPLRTASLLSASRLPRESQGEPLSSLLSAHACGFEIPKEAVRVKDLGKGEEEEAGGACCSELNNEGGMGIEDEERHQ